MESAFDVLSLPITKKLSELFHTTDLEKTKDLLVYIRLLYHQKTTVQNN